MHEKNDTEAHVVSIVKCKANIALLLHVVGSCLRISIPLRRNGNRHISLSSMMWKDRSASELEAFLTISQAQDLKEELLCAFRPLRTSLDIPSTFGTTLTLLHVFDKSFSFFQLIRAYLDSCSIPTSDFRHQSSTRFGVRKKLNQI